jgi:hypothetical protein
MELNDVILTASESAYLAAKHLEKYKCLDTFGRTRDKAQCRKLLDVLNESCKEHLVTQKVNSRNSELVFSDRYSGLILMDCPECMSEIKKLLKEQND